MSVLKFVKMSNEMLIVSVLLLGRFRVLQSWNCFSLVLVKNEQNEQSYGIPSPPILELFLSCSDQK